MMSKADFVRARDKELVKAADIDAEITALSETGVDEVLRSADIGTVKESLFQFQKRRKREIQAILDGAIDQKDCSYDLLKDVAGE